jgi:beta-hydroxylase
MFYDPERFEFAARLKAQWTVVRDELHALARQEFQSWPEHYHYGERGWDTFDLYAFGHRQAENCAKCPRTDELLQQIPGLMMAGFSRLGPGAHIRPHKGYDGYAGYILRFHLGLDVPGDCALRVGDETRSWAEGECLVFDDSIEHEAWNRSERERTVLLLDFFNPYRRRPLFLNPRFSPELVNVIEAKQQRQRQTWPARLSWRVWKALHPDIVAQARQIREGARVMRAPES